MGSDPAPFFAIYFLTILRADELIRQSRKLDIRRATIFANVFRFTDALTRDVSRGAWLPANQYGIPNSYPKLIKN